MYSVGRLTSILIIVDKCNFEIRSNSFQMVNKLRLENETIRATRTYNTRTPKTSDKKFTNAKSCLDLIFKPFAAIVIASRRNIKYLSSQSKQFAI